MMNYIMEEEAIQNAEITLVRRLGNLISVMPLSASFPKCFYGTVSHI